MTGYGRALPPEYVQWKRRSAERVAALLAGLGLEQELKFWQEQSKELERLQVRERPPVPGMPAGDLDARRDGRRGVCPRPGPASPRSLRSQTRRARRQAHCDTDVRQAAVRADPEGIDIGRTVRGHRRTQHVEVLGIAAERGID